MRRGWSLRGASLGWLWPRSVRARTTLASTVLVVAAIGVGAFGLLTLLQRDLAANLRHTALVRANDLAAVLQNGGPVSQVAAGVGGDSLVQIINARGTVIAASADIAGEPPMVRLAPAPGQVLSRTLASIPADEGAYTVVTLGVQTSQGRLVVAVAQSRTSLVASRNAVRDGIIVGLPLLALVVGAVGWVTVGRALRPVEAIRRRVASIGPHARGTRVPQPATDDEIGRLARTMNDMLARLDQANAQQRRFVSDASHELRSPVSSIRTQLEVAGTYRDQALDPELATNLLAETERLETLVADLLLLARLDEATAPPFAEVDLDDLVQDEANRLRARGRVQVDTTGVTVTRVRGDAAQLRRAVSNLADNAERHAAGAVRFACGTDDAGHPHIIVSDDGPGVPPHQRERIFARFTRSDDARARDAGGAGLGLAIVTEVARAHGGSVRILDPTTGETGARFELTLPPQTAPNVQLP